VKRLGPDLKMPKLKGSEIKVPPFLSDLYYDLSERRLLPIIALILVAIVAAPFLLGGGSGDSEERPEVAPIAGASSANGGTSLTVVQARPGLRNYKERLAHRKPTNPFKQRFDGTALKGAGLNEQTSTTTTETTTSTETVETTPSESGGGSGKATPGEIVYFAFAINVQITRTETNTDGSLEKSGPTMHKGILPPTLLPGEKAQVITYMGRSPKTGKPLFLVSPDVTSVFGEAKCVSGSGLCQLIELNLNEPEVFVYGAEGTRYKFNVTKIEPVATGHS
jgi:hypothetical protein